MPSDLLDLQPGTVLRGTPYRVVKRVGAGGMGALFECEHVRLKRKRVAVKVLQPGLRGKADYLERMELEGQTLARLDHPGIVKIFDLGVTDDGIPYFVMEMLAGKDLRRVLTSRRFLDLTDALGIVEEVLQALAHAHREGVVHRDIKPENIFLAVSETYTSAKVLDFGIAAVADDRRQLTGERFIGTCQYSAPEQIRGEVPTERTDIYAVGCVLFELIAGRRPFPGPKAPDYMRQHLHDLAPRLSTFLPVPPLLDALVASALEKDPSKRPLSALWFASQLHQILQTAENVPLATAETTQEMLLTAVTEGAASSGLRGPINDTVRDAELPFALEGTSPEGRPRDETTETSPIDAPGGLGLREARTRTAPPAAPLTPTEELGPIATDRSPQASARGASSPGRDAPAAAGSAQTEVPLAQLGGRRGLHTALLSAAIVTSVALLMVLASIVVVPLLASRASPTAASTATSAEAPAPPPGSATQPLAPRAVETSAPRDVANAAPVSSHAAAAAPAPSALAPALRPARAPASPITPSRASAAATSAASTKPPSTESPRAPIKVDAPPAPAKTGSYVEPDRTM